MTISTLSQINKRREIKFNLYVKHLANEDNLLSKDLDLVPQPQMVKYKIQNIITNNLRAGEGQQFENADNRQTKKKKKKKEMSFFYKPHPLLAQSKQYNILLLSALRSMSPLTTTQ